MEPMSTETVDLVPGDQAQAEQAEPEQKTGVAPQDEPQGEDQSPPEDKELSEEQKTIRKLQRRIERLSGKVGATARERDMLREQMASVPKGEDQKTEPDLNAVATERAKEILRTEKLNSRADATLKAGKAIEGFSEALETLRDEIAFADDKGRVTPFFEALLDADAPAKVIHYLGTNPDEAAEFEGLSPAQIGRRIAKLEAKLDGDAKIKTSSAPVPLKPVRGAAPDSGGSDEKGISDEEWARRRDRELRSKRA
jgi:hypothetical protein